MNDGIKRSHHVTHTFFYCNGYYIPRTVEEECVEILLKRFYQGLNTTPTHCRLFDISRNHSPHKCVQELFLSDHPLLCFLQETPLARYLRGMCCLDRVHHPKDTVCRLSLRELHIPTLLLLVGVYLPTDSRLRHHF